MEIIVLIIIVLIIIMKKAFDQINKDFLILPQRFIPLIPGNDPNDFFNEEKQL